MLNVIEEILLKSMPTSQNSAEIKELVTRKKGCECKLIVSELMQGLSKEDEELISKIKSFLESQHTKDPDYQYELMLMHIGAMYYNHDMLMSLDQVVNSAAFSNLIENDKEILKDYVAELSELYKKHETIFADMFKYTKDKKIQIKIKCFKEQECLYDLPKYRYERYIRTIGMIVFFQN